MNGSAVSIRALIAARVGTRAVVWRLLLATLVVAAAVTYGVVLLQHIHSIIVDLLWDSDFASGPVVAQTVARVGSAGNTWISTTGAWMDLWFGLVTAHLPLHRQLWEVAPSILFLVCAGVIGRATRRVAGIPAGLAAALVVLLSSPWALQILIAPVAHNTVYPTTAILGALLPWVLRHGDRGRRLWGATVVAGAVVLGADIASDKLVLVTGVIPLALTAVACTWQRSPQARLAGAGILAMLVLSLPVLVATNAIMRAEGFFTTAPPLGFASPSHWGFHVLMLYAGLRGFSGGYLLLGPGAAAHVVFGALSVICAVGALAALLWAGLRSILGLVRDRGMETASLGRQLHVAYWFLSAMTIIATFIVSSADDTAPRTHSSYFLTVIFSTAAVLPVVASTPAHRGRHFLWRIVPIGLVILAVADIVGVTGAHTIGAPALASEAGGIVQFARSENATYGYAGYWDASSLTWSTREAVRVRPLLNCANPEPTGSDICPFLLMRTASWYRHTPRRTFLIVDPDGGFVTSLPTNLGTPLAERRIGTITMYVYPYNIATKLGPYPIWNP